MTSALLGFRFAFAVVALTSVAAARVGCERQTLVHRQEAARLVEKRSELAAARGELSVRLARATAACGSGTTVHAAAARP